MAISGRPMTGIRARDNVLLATRFSKRRRERAGPRPEAAAVRLLYDPVWISGQVAAESSVQAVRYVDGNAHVETSYTSCSRRWSSRIASAYPGVKDGTVWSRSRRGRSGTMRSGASARGECTAIAKIDGRI
jgi:hypothetical protein